jgi:hypothetical protein
MQVLLMDEEFQVLVDVQEWVLLSSELGNCMTRKEFRNNILAVLLPRRRYLLRLSADCKNRSLAFSVGFLTLETDIMDFLILGKPEVCE